MFDFKTLSIVNDESFILFSNIVENFNSGEMLDSKLISKARRSAIKAKIRMACVACIAYRHRCSDSRPCKSCLKAKRQCVEGGNLTSKYESRSWDIPRAAPNLMPQLNSALTTERDSSTRLGRSGLEWAHAELRHLMGMGFRVEFLERFISHLPASDGQELEKAMVMSNPSDTNPNTHVCSGLPENGAFELDTQIGSEIYATSSTALDRTNGQRSLYTNPKKVALLGMRCEENTTRSSIRHLSLPYSEVDALILLLYRSVYHIRGQEPAVTFLRMYIGTTRTGSLIRESLIVENDELHQREKVALSSLYTLNSVTCHLTNCTNHKEAVLLSLHFKAPAHCSSCPSSLLLLFSADLLPISALSPSLSLLSLPPQSLSASSSSSHLPCPS